MSARRPPLAVALAALAVLTGCPDAPPRGSRPPAAAGSAGMPAYGSWRSSAIGGGGYVQQVVLAPSDPRRCYTYVDVGGAYRSDDGGRSWRMIHGGLPADRHAYEVRGLAVDPRDADRVVLANGPGHGLYLSENGGRSWTLVRTASFHGNDQRRYAGAVLARDPADADHLLAGSADAGILLSLDGGRTWGPDGDAGMGRIIDLQFHPAIRGLAFACTARQDSRGVLHAGGFWRSADGGRTWSQAAPEGPSEIACDPLVVGRIYGIFAFAEIRRSDDGGGTWTAHARGLPCDPTAPTVYNGPHYFTALAAGPDFILAGNGRGEVFRLAAGNEEWKQVPCARRGMIYQGREWFRRTGFGWAMGSLAVDPGDPRRWFMTDWYGLYQSGDGGLSWSMSMDGIEATVVFSLAAAADDPRRIHLGMADNGYLRSRDGGGSFSYEGQADAGFGMASQVVPAPSDSRRVYLLGWNHQQEVRRLKVSDDGGDRFAEAGTTGLPATGATFQSVAVHPGDAQLVYLAASGAVAPGGGGVYRSQDGGRRWQWFGEGLPAGETCFPAALWGSGGELAVGPGGDLVCIARRDGRIFRRGAGDAAWTAVPNPVPGRPLAAVCAEIPAADRFFIAAADSGILRSEDGGRSWRRVFQRATRAVATHSAAAGRVAAGTAEGVAVSLDGGSTWRMLDQRLPARGFVSGVAFVGDRVLAATGGCGVFWSTLDGDDGDGR